MSKGNPIPAEQRTLVENRDLWRCTHCGMKATDWHHRRSRRIRDAHQHCACNGVMLCRTCHSWAHAHPSDAREYGLIVGQWHDRPWLVPVRRIDGWWLLRCMGTGLPMQINEVEFDFDSGEPFLGPEAIHRLRIDTTSAIW